MTALATLRNAENATDAAQNAVDRSCRDSAVLLGLAMTEAIYMAEALVADTKQCVDYIEEGFVAALEAMEGVFAKACENVHGMTREQARHFYDTARGTKRVFRENIVEAATKVALNCMEEKARLVSRVTKRLLSECDGRIMMEVEPLAKRAVVVRDPRRVL